MLFMFMLLIIDVSFFFLVTNTNTSTFNLFWYTERYKHIHILTLIIVALTVFTYIHTQVHIFDYIFLFFLKIENALLPNCWLNYFDELILFREEIVSCLDKNKYKIRFYFILNTLTACFRSVKRINFNSFIFYLYFISNSENCLYFYSVLVYVSTLLFLLKNIFLPKTTLFVYNLPV